MTRSCFVRVSFLQAACWIVAGSLLFSVNIEARPKKSKRPPKPPAAHVALKNAYDALEKGVFARLRGQALKVQVDRSFQDHALYLLAQSETIEADVKLKASQNQEAIKHLGKSDQFLLRCLAEYPETALKTKLNEGLVSNGWMKGTAWIKQKNRTNAFNALDTALARASDFKFPPIQIPTQALDDYSKLCFEMKDPVCQSRLNRLIIRYPRASLEAKAIRKNFPDVIFEKEEPEVYDRFSVAYRTVQEPDYEAMDHAMSLVVMGKKSDALSELKAFLKEYPRSSSRLRAQYWKARLGDEDEAEAGYRSVIQDSPFGYYAILSSLALKKPLPESLGESIEETPLVLSEQVALLKPQEIQRLKKAEAMLKVKAYAAARIELTGFSSRKEWNNQFLAQLARYSHDAGLHDQTVDILIELQQRGDPRMKSESILPILFPTQVVPEEKPDPLWVWSLIKQESGFSPEAISRVGATGLMQLMPVTAVDIDPKLSLFDLKNPAKNMALGTQYLTQLLNRYKGNYVFALAAYNAGATRVDRWRKEIKTDWEMIEFVESIPYKETREYVQQIFRNYYWYQYRVKGKVLTDLSDAWPNPKVEEEKSN